MVQKILSFLFIGAAILTFSSCNEEVEPKSLAVPSTYEFTRDGESTVSFQGQTDRLDMLSEMKTYLSNASKGEEIIDANKLLNMFANENSPFNDADLNNSTKQIKDKTAITDIGWYENLFSQAEAVSQDVAANDTQATEGNGGYILRSNGSRILVNDKGWEFTQMVEKGLMGSLIYQQIMNIYLGEAKTGDDVENTALVEGQNYTAMEHHWDEAFGYWGVPTDFPQGDPVLEGAERRFWANYTNGMDAFLGVNQKLMDAYLKGRTAIVNKDMATKNEQKAIILHQHELIAAANAIHYLNSAIENLDAEEWGDLMHHASEGYGFVRALLAINPSYSATSASDITPLLLNGFGTDENFWDISIESLQDTKAKLVELYPELESVKDSL